MKKHLDLAFLLAFFWLGGVAQAQVNGGAEEHKHAFVVGVANYETAPLSNPGNDARLMAQTLAQIGFNVHGGGPLIDPTARELQTEFIRFAVGLKPGAHVVFYFSGHGSQTAGDNLLLPRDFHVSPSSVEEMTRSARLQSLLLGDVLSHFEDAEVGLSIVLLDCCRSTSSSLSASGITIDGSLAPPDDQATSSGDVLIGFAAKHGRVALDGIPGSNGPFTAALAKRLARPGVGLRQTFDLVTQDVLEMTQQKQQPYFYGSLRDEVYLAGQPLGLQPSSSASPSVLGAPETLDRLVAQLLDVNTRSAVQRLTGPPRVSQKVLRSQSNLQTDLLYERISTDRYSVQFFYDLASENADKPLVAMVVHLNRSGSLSIARGHPDNVMFTLGQTTVAKLLNDSNPEEEHIAGGGRYPAVVYRFYFGRLGGYMSYQVSAPIVDISTERPNLDEAFSSFAQIRGEGLSEFISEYVACPYDWLEGSAEDSSFTDNDPSPSSAPTGSPMTNQEQIKQSVIDFVNSHLGSYHSNSSSDWAAHFAAYSDYVYHTDGLAPRSVVEKDRTRFIQQYPYRSYEVLNNGTFNYQLVSDYEATASYSISYQISNTETNKSGRTSVQLTLERDGTRWWITKFNESVIRD